MKELSIKDEALDVVKQIVADGQISQEVAEKYFPELKESDDERIRKALIQVFNVENFEGYDIKNEEVIAWLEKQGEHAKFRNKIQIGDEVTRNEDGVLVNVSQLNRIAKKRKKQGEQESTDKIEAKFYEGDWITFTRKDGTREVLQVSDIIDGRYYFNHLLHFSWSIKECNEKCHLWTIADAKPGDILVTSDGRPFIFRGLLDKFHPQAPVAYCGIDSEDEFSISSGIGWWTDDEVFPATKEQCDFLFQKMKEAGYEWDINEKKLEPMDTEQCYANKECQEKMKEALQTEYEKGRADAIAEMQKSAWSEKDESQIELLTGMCDEQQNNSAVYSTMYRAVEELKTWLKSLKERYTWKPSDQQIRALEYIIDNANNTSYSCSIAKDLLADLKKLKEE